MWISFIRFNCYLVSYYRNRLVSFILPLLVWLDFSVVPSCQYYMLLYVFLFTSVSEFIQDIYLDVQIPAGRKPGVSFNFTR